jgi:hypothetical protein
MLMPNPSHHHPAPGDNYRNGLGWPHIRVECEIDARPAVEIAGYLGPLSYGSEPIAHLTEMETSRREVKRRLLRSQETDEKMCRLAPPRLRHLRCGFRADAFLVRGLDRFACRLRRVRNSIKSRSSRQFRTRSLGTPPFRAISTPQWVKAISAVECASGLMLIMHPSSRARPCQRESRSRRRALA